MSDLLNLLFVVDVVGGVLFRIYLVVEVANLMCWALLYPGMVTMILEFHVECVESYVVLSHDVRVSSCLLYFCHYAFLEDLMHGAVC